MRECKYPDGKKNWVGKRIAKARKKCKMSQNTLAVQLQRLGVDIDKNAIQLLEHGHRYVRDMEVYSISKVLKISLEDLFRDIEQQVINDESVD